MSSHSLQPQNERLILGIAGRIGSGKTSTGKYLSSTHGFQYLRYSLVLSEWLAKDPESKSHLQEVGWKVMAGGMQTELNRRMIEQIKPGADAAVDGLRHSIDLECLRNCFLTSFYLLYIDSPLKVRWEHLKGHSRYTDFASFEAADSHPVEQQIESLRAKAALVIQNEGSLQDLYHAVDKAVRSITREGQS
jgi:dephospho-CoA kinase